MFGIPGLALFVFLFLMNKFNFSFSQIGPIWSAIIVVIFLVSVFLIVYVALRTNLNDNSKSVLHEYETFKKGLHSTFDNVKLIERIANSNDKNSMGYLQNLSSETNLSWIEKVAIEDAMKCMKEKIKADNLYEIAKKREWAKIDDMFKDVPNDKELLTSIFKQLKYWRYINRRNHPEFDKVEKALVYGPMGQLSIEELKDILVRISI